MIAIPVKLPGENPEVSAVFTKSKWFAFIANDTMTVERNENKTVYNIVQWFVQMGIDKVILTNLDKNLFLILEEENIECFYAVGERVFLTDIIDRVQQNKLIKISMSNLPDYI